MRIRIQIQHLVLFDARFSFIITPKVYFLHYLFKFIANFYLFNLKTLRWVVMGKSQ